MWIGTNQQHGFGGQLQVAENDRAVGALHVRPEQPGY